MIGKVFIFMKKAVEVKKDVFGEYESKVYQIEDIMQILDIKRGLAYTLLNSGEFPVLRVGTRYRIPKEAFNEWLDKKLKGEKK